MMKRLLAMVLSIVMVISMLPVQAFAQEGIVEEAVAETQPAQEIVVETTVPAVEEETLPIQTEAPAVTQEPTVPTQALEETVPVTVEQTLPAETEEETVPAETEEVVEEVVAEEAAAATSGTCGTGLTWSLAGGTLTISGTGSMADYSTGSSAPWFSERVSITSIVIEEGVTSIGSYAFYYCVNAVSVSIPSTVTSIGSSAFYECSALTAVEIPSGVKYINNYMFYNCTSLGSVSIPETVTEISYGAFYNCTSLKEISIPNSVTSIGSYAFKGCTALKSVVIPEGVKTIQSETFYGCTSLESVTIPNSVTSIGNSAFYGCASLSEVSIPEAVTSIGYRAFAYCTSLTAINLPEGITTVSSSLFAGCTGLTEIVIPKGVATIESYAFDGCTGLKKVTIPDGVITIGSCAFEGCTSLTAVTIPEGVTSIGSYAFRECTGLMEITIPESVTTIGGYAFYGCSALKEITIPSTVTNIGQEAFRNCTSLTAVKGSVSANIGSSAFSGCTALETITLAEGVTSIGYRTFYNCSALKEITIPSTVTAIGQEAFYNCTSLTAVQGSVSANIGSSAFYGCTALETITLVEGVTTIGEHAFNKCAALKEITIPSTVTAIGDAAFANCSSLTKVSGSICVDIGNSAFYGCSALESITLAEGVTAIGAYAFKQCAALKEIAIPSTVTAIGQEAFYNCTSLTAVKGSVSANIGSSAFYGCTALETITLAEGVTSIGRYAFYNCSALKEITIPSTVTAIGSSAFAYCPKLNQISFSHLSSDTLEIYDSAFYLSDSYNYKDVLTTVYVPYARDIHAAISGYAWADYGRDVTFKSSGYLPVETITIDTHPAEIEAGLKVAFTATMDPWYCTSDLIWEVVPGTGNATIDQDGVLIGTEPGFVTVRCTSSDNVAKYDESQIEILAPTAYVSSITIRCDGDFEAEVEEGGKVQMIADVEPGNAMDKSVVWEVENGTGSARISDDGILSGISAGTVTVFAIAQDGTEVMGSRLIEVVRYVQDITIFLNGDAASAQLGVGEKATLSAQVSPGDANYTGVTWSVENGTGEATLSQYNSGYRLTGVTAGTVTLIATSTDSPRLSVSKEIEIVGEKAAYAVTGGNIYYNTVTGTIVGCDSTVTSANIPGIISGTKITAIAPDAFRNIDSLATVTIPSAVTQIGEYAFYDCEGLTSLRINGKGLKTVGSYAFSYCDSLTKLTIPESVTFIGTHAFYSLDNLKTLTISSEDVTIESYAFWDLSNLTELTIPGDLNCRNWLSYNGVLETLTLTGKTIVSTANYEVDKYGNLSWWGEPAGRDAEKVIISDSVESIEEFAFIGSDNIEDITIGNGVTSIGRYAFYNCDGLTTVTVGSNVKTVGPYAFYNCDALTEVILPEGIETLGERTFSGCYNLEKLNLPDSLKSIGRYCFAIEKDGEVKLQLIDLSGNPTRMETQELQLTYKIPTVLVTGTNKQNQLYWNLVYTYEDYLAGKPDPYEIAWIDSNGLLCAWGSGTVTVSCWDEYTGAQGTWTIDISSGVVIRSEDDQNYVVSGDTLQLSAWMMPGGEKVAAFWYLREQDTAYATINEETGKLTAKNVSGAHQIEVTAQPHNGSDPATMQLWVVPKTTGLYIYEGAGDVTGSELNVDMALRPTMQLTAVAQPEGAMGDVTWKTSSNAIASVDGGLVTFNSPGTVTITATSTDGSGKSASVKISVIYRDTVKTLTAVVDAQNNTLEAGESARMLVYGSDPDNALDASQLEFGIPDSQLSIATVDDTGLITAGEKAGTVNVTASLKGDPLGRRVTVKLTVIARQTQKLVLRTDAPEPAQVQMLDGNGNVTADAEEAANYVVLLKKTDVEEGDYTFIIQPEAFTAKGEMELTKSSLKWATSNSKLATVSVNDDGTALVTVKAGSDGACVISAVTTDAAKVENRLTVNVRDFAPRLETDKPALNTNLTEAAVLGLVESYGNAITGVALYESDGTVSDRLIPVYEAGVLTICAKEAISNGTLQLRLLVTCADGVTYEFPLKAKVSNSAPDVTIKQQEKLNLFYADSETQVTLTAKNARIADVVLTDTASFTADYDPDSGEMVLGFSEAYREDPSGKPDTKATLLVYLEDYNQPIAKALTIGTNSKKPTVQTSVTASVININAAGEKAAAFGFVIKGSTELLELDNAQVEVTAGFASHRIQDDQVVLTLTGNSGGTATVLLQLDNWMEPIKLTHKVTVETKNPTLKLDSATLKLNSIFTEQTASTAASLSQSNQDIFNITFACATADAEKLRVSYDPETGHVTAAIADPDDAPMAGSYVYTATASLSDGTVLSPVKLKVTVAATAPKVKVNTSTLKLNKVLCGNETAVTDFTLNKGEGFTLVGFAELEDWEHDAVWLDFVDGQLTAELRDSEADNKTHSFKLTPILLDETTGQEAALPTTVTVKVQVYKNEKITVSLSSKGKLDAVDPNSEIVYTIKKITNASGSVTGVSLVGQDADKFAVSLNDDGTVSLKLVENEVYSTKQTYKVQFAFTICGQDVLSSVISFKVTQSTLKLTAPSAAYLYQSQTMPLRVTLLLTTPEGARIEAVTLGSKSAQTFLDAMGEEGMDVTISEDGRSAEVSFDVQNAASLAYGKSYVLYLDVTASGSTAEAKPTQVKLTVKVEK